MQRKGIKVISKKDKIVDIHPQSEEKSVFGGLMNKFCGKVVVDEKLSEKEVSLGFFEAHPKKDQMFSKVVKCERELELSENSSN